MCGRRKGHIGIPSHPHPRHKRLQIALTRSVYGKRVQVDFAVDNGRGDI